jgi:hypothetical protein
MNDSSQGTINQTSVPDDEYIRDVGEPDTEPTYEDGLKLGKMLGYEEGYKKGHYDANVTAYWLLLQQEKRK